MYLSLVPSPKRSIYEKKRGTIEKKYTIEKKERYRRKRIYRREILRFLNPYLKSYVNYLVEILEAIGLSPDLVSLWLSS